MVVAPTILRIRAGSGGWAGAICLCVQGSKVRNQHSALAKTSSIAPAASQPMETANSHLQSPRRFDARRSARITISSLWRITQHPCSVPLAAPPAFAWQSSRGLVRPDPMPGRSTTMSKMSCFGSRPSASGRSKQRGQPVRLCWRKYESHPDRSSQAIEPHGTVARTDISAGRDDLVGATEAALVEADERTVSLACAKAEAAYYGRRT